MGVALKMVPYYVRVSCKFKLKKHRRKVDALKKGCQQR
jgi:hypothetical protein